MPSWRLNCSEVESKTQVNDLHLPMLLIFCLVVQLWSKSESALAFVSITSGGIKPDSSFRAQEARWHFPEQLPTPEQRAWLHRTRHVAIKGNVLFSLTSSASQMCKPKDNDVKSNCVRISSPANYTAFGDIRDCCRTSPWSIVTVAKCLC